MMPEPADDASPYRFGRVEAVDMTTRRRRMALALVAALGVGLLLVWLLIARVDDRSVRDAGADGAGDFREFSGTVQLPTIEPTVPPTTAVAPGTFAAAVDMLRTFDAATPPVMTEAEAEHRLAERAYLVDHVCQTGLAEQSTLDDEALALIERECGAWLSPDGS